MITTVTAYWNRPTMLPGWCDNLVKSPCKHIIYFIGELPPPWWEARTRNTGIITVIDSNAPGLSIGHYHNLGIDRAETEWVMKLDIDTVPHSEFFPTLAHRLERAQPHEWFNVGMLMAASTARLDGELTVAAYDALIAAQRFLPPFPVGTNFVCRRADYLALGGCDPRFRGYGWEDYQQITMLEWGFKGSKPLGDGLHRSNVTQRSKEMSRRKSAQLWAEDRRLALVHRWHLRDESKKYRFNMDHNKTILLEHVMKYD